MYNNKDDQEPFEQKVWLASPTMHGEELEYVTEAYNTNWMSTVGVGVILTTKLRFGLSTNDRHHNGFYSNMHKAVA